jgi:hypothetical protein
VLDVEGLGAKDGPPDRSLPNGSSIALLIEHRGATVLLGANAYAGTLVQSLRSLAQHRRVTLPWPVDLFKLSHHGSRGNVNAELLKSIRARRFVFSTNNAIFNLPDDEAVAQVLMHGGRGAELWFNYATARNRRWGQKQLCERHGYAARFPEGIEGGVSINLPVQAIASSSA